MFDINLLNDPGLQTDSSIPKIDSNIESDISKKKNSGKNKEEVVPKKEHANYYLISLVIICILSISSIGYYFFGDFNIKDFQAETRDVPIQEIFNILDKYENIDIDNIDFSNFNFSVVLNISKGKLFYLLLDDLAKELEEDVKGYHVNNTYNISIQLPWDIDKENKSRIEFLNEKISGSKLDVKTEIYKEKLIMVSDFKNIIKILKLINDLNMINRFSISIDDIESLPNGIKLYQAIIT